ncbi:ADP-heptose--LPS heptosyltransferase 2 [bacterium BMS3Abin03]|nr:ADP-heptose--LPS heptosyltransferase 2 [bacterium BMS3Abin03]
MKKIRLLLSRIDRIGDVILSTAIPREVKKKLPGSFIAVLVKKYTKDIYLNNPYIDEIIVFDEAEKSQDKFWSIVSKIRKYKFTHAFMLLPNERLNWILFFSGIPKRIGVGRKLYQFLTFTKFVDRKKYISLRHEADYCMDMVRKIGIEPESIEPEIFLSNEEKIFIEGKRNEYLKDHNFIVGINVTSGNSAPNLPAAEYKKITEKLAADKNIKVVITDNKPPKELLNLEKVEYPNLNSPLRKSILNIAAIDILISASTGPMHIAAALKVKTLSLFCPLTACSPKLWGPLGNESTILLPKNEYCSNHCPGDPKICNYSGDSGIDSSRIIAELNHIIEK